MGVTKDGAARVTGDEEGSGISSSSGVGSFDFSNNGSGVAGVSF